VPHSSRSRQNTKHTNPAVVFEDLKRRELDQIEQCRIAWQQAQDPLALIVGVIQSDLPEWLVDGLLVVLGSKAVLGSKTPRLKTTELDDLWKQRGRDARDVARAFVVANMRALPNSPKWEDVLTYANMIVNRQYDDAGHVSNAAINKSYQKVRRSLGNKGLYFRTSPATRERILKALERHAEILRAALPPVKVVTKKRS
jgi:hypothetical protein